MPLKVIQKYSTIPAYSQTFALFDVHHSDSGAKKVILLYQKERKEPVRNGHMY